MTSIRCFCAITTTENIIPAGSGCNHSIPSLHFTMLFYLLECIFIVVVSSQIAAVFSHALHSPQFACQHNEPRDCLSDRFPISKIRKSIIGNDVSASKTATILLPPPRWSLPLSLSLPIHPWPYSGLFPPPPHYNTLGISSG